MRKKIKKLQIIFLRNFFLLTLALFLLQEFSNFSSTRFITTDILIIFLAFFGFFWLFFFLKNQKKEKQHTKTLKYTFLFTFLLTSFASLGIGPTGGYVFQISVVTAGLGFLIFFLEKENMTKGKLKEKQLWYTVGLVVIFLLFFVTRFYDNYFINGSDNYNIVGMKNLYENGANFYKSTSITDTMALFIIKVFGFNLISIKIPYIIYSFITLVFIFLISKKIDQRLSLIAPFLYTISPWAIITARITRDYSFDLMLASIVIFLSFIIIERAKDSKNIKVLIKNILLFSLLPIGTYLLYKFNRSQTLVVGIYTIFPFIYLLSLFFKNNTIQKKIFWITSSIFLITGFFYLSHTRFDYGINETDWTFLNMYFDPRTESPWQWFHNTGVNYILIAFFFVLGVFTLSKKQKLLNILFCSFVFGIFLFDTKFLNHLEYIPTRYAYFLFIPYLILISKGILNLLEPFNKFEKIAVVLILFSFINYTSIIYSITPKIAYERENINNLEIDNINIGQFFLIDVVKFLEDELKVDDRTILVFGGRHDELTLYLNRPMDAERKLTRDSGGTYNVAKNTYVVSDYFGYYELEEAITNHEKGIYVARHSNLYYEDGEGRKRLDEEDFKIYDTNFTFLKNINGFKIYSWQKI